MIKNVSLILAVGPKGLIGVGNKLAWRSKTDLMYFKELTKNHPCIFGATTFFGLPKQPLNDRINIVLDNTQKEEFVVDRRGWIVCNNAESAVRFAENYNEVFICGGKSIYEYALEHLVVTKIYLTQVSSKNLEELVESDDKSLVYFNIYDKIKDWKAETLKEEIEVDSFGQEFNLKFQLYTKCKK